MTITVSMDIPLEKLTDLAKALSELELEEEAKKVGFKTKKKKADPVPVPEVPAVVAEPAEPAKAVPANEPEPEQVTKDPEPKAVKVTKAMLRARGIELTKAEKTGAIEEIFKKFGAKRLGDVEEENYEEVYKLMGEQL